jgi:hypothetical protein
MLILQLGLQGVPTLRNAPKSCSWVQSDPPAAPAVACVLAWPAPAGECLVMVGCQEASLPPQMMAVAIRRGGGCAQTP